MDRQQAEAEHGSYGDEQNLHIEGSQVVGSKIGENPPKGRTSVDNGEKLEAQVRGYRHPRDCVELHVYKDYVDARVAEDQTATEQHVRCFAEPREIDKRPSFCCVFEWPHDHDRKYQGDENDEGYYSRGPASTNSRL